VVYVVKDLSHPTAPEELAKWIADNNLPLSVLVNNAGYALWGRFDEQPLNDQVDMLHVNVECMVKLTHLLLPLLKKQQQAYILNIASTTAYQAIPTLSVYAACKSFVILFSRALRYEFKDTNISVTCISPGTTSTNFMNRAGMTSEKMIKQAEKVTMAPEEVAKCAVSKMLKKKNEVIPGLINRVSVAMTYFVPKALTEKIAAGIYKN
jgi:short-subunit dehydrogenase